jgi:signal transduction histidine kinase
LLWNETSPAHHPSAIFTDIFCLSLIKATIMAHSLASASPEILNPSQIQAFIEKQVYLRTKELTQRTRELKEQNDYLLNLHNEKNDWLQMLVHDLKNPLASIMLAGSFLERYWQRMSLTEFMRNTQTIQASATRMNTLIGRVLSIGALESGAMDLALDHINVTKTIDVAVQEYSSRAAAKDIHIVLESESDNIFVYADRCAMLEIIDNLLSNAVKYSPLGSSIRICVSTNTPEKNDIKTVRIEFHDQGPGIKPEEFGKLFTKFTRLSSQPTGGEHSSGLGLAVVQKLANAMQGKVWCESEYGKGSAFIVEFPFAQPKQYLDVVNLGVMNTDEQADDSSPLDHSASTAIPVAIGGFDTVGYFLLGRPVGGNSSISTEWNGKRWLFENEHHKALFMENPTRFAPKYHGFCALGMSRNALGYGNPEAFDIVNDELFFAFNLEVLQMWKEKQREYITVADEHWKNNHAQV